MPDPSLSAEELAAILEGTAPDLADHPVARFVARSRDALAAESGPPPSGELAALMADQAVTAPAPPPESAAEVIDLTATPDPHPRRIPVFAALTSFLGTLGGKVAVGTVAAASVAGAHAAGVVDVPLLPDDEPSVVEVDDHDDESDDHESERDQASVPEIDESEVEESDDHDADDSESDDDESDDHDADDADESDDDD
ncbi:MAG: hypothetical protein GWN07_25595, partial [Actinobacteria bacterium]|nr:hypothetical protein [Actinomycetota bacterium]NIU68753.1 hypothetical protein [Actinomycetota bacterium]NIV88860.1 hypothetical protein [Actinomycetota bacterium]NIX23021.1 hypothetical protein [Actinomycetota bacterium]